MMLFFRENTIVNKKFMNIIMEFRYYFIFLTNRKSFGDVKIFMNIILDFTGFDDVLLGVGNEKFMNINYLDFL